MYGSLCSAQCITVYCKLYCLLYSVLYYTLYCIYTVPYCTLVLCCTLVLNCTLVPYCTPGTVLLSELHYTLYCVVHCTVFTLYCFVHLYCRVHYTVLYTVWLYYIATVLWYCLVSCKVYTVQSAVHCTVLLHYVLYYSTVPHRTGWLTLISLLSKPFGFSRFRTIRLLTEPDSTQDYIFRFKNIKITVVVNNNCTNFILAHLEESM